MSSNSPFEPDEAWKADLRARTEANLQDLIKDAENDMHEALEAAPTQAVKYKLQSEYQRMVDEYRRDARAMFNAALEDERTRRKHRTSGQRIAPAMRSEQTAIVNKVRDDRQTTDARQPVGINNSATINQHSSSTLGMSICIFGLVLKYLADQIWTPTVSPDDSPVKSPTASQRYPNSVAGRPRAESSSSVHNGPVSTIASGDASQSSTRPTSHHPLLSASNFAKRSVTNFRNITPQQQPTARPSSVISTSHVSSTNAHGSGAPGTPNTRGRALPGSQPISIPRKANSIYGDGVVDGARANGATGVSQSPGHSVDRPPIWRPSPGSRESTTVRAPSVSPGKRQRVPSSASPGGAPISAHVQAQLSSSKDPLLQPSSWEAIKANLSPDVYIPDPPPPHPRFANRHSDTSDSTSSSDSEDAATRFRKHEDALLEEKHREQERWKREEERWKQEEARQREEERVKGLAPLSYSRYSAELKIKQEQEKARLAQITAARAKEQALEEDVNSISLEAPQVVDVVPPSNDFTVDGRDVSVHDIDAAEVVPEADQTVELLKKPEKSSTYLSPVISEESEDEAEDEHEEESEDDIAAQKRANAAGFMQTSSASAPSPSSPPSAFDAQDDEYDDIAAQKRANAAMFSGDESLYSPSSPTLQRVEHAAEASGSGCPDANWNDNEAQLSEVLSRWKLDMKRRDEDLRQRGADIKAREDAVIQREQSVQDKELELQQREGALATEQEQLQQRLEALHQAEQDYLALTGRPVPYESLYSEQADGNDECVSADLDSWDDGTQQQQESPHQMEFRRRAEQIKRNRASTQQAGYGEYDRRPSVDSKYAPREWASARRPSNSSFTTTEPSTSPLSQPYPSASRYPAPRKNSTASGWAQRARLQSTV
ncbi:hypothetical protein FISHEDRAFT_58902 [Fistulina hepatica ATCC 64428]|uniref:Uncharacterized protein n=1 Tax=Fistulina hepatica ATCC 64428 TaxID=1128425 RepID=A0A0D7AC34_9AGAR|nr:hypothetical protein FISHEDRAFT_58902 [Fistulina hepatica ATCC 64428]